MDMLGDKAMLVVSEPGMEVVVEVDELRDDRFVGLWLHEVLLA